MLKNKIKHLFYLVCMLFGFYTAAEQEVLPQDSLDIRPEVMMSNIIILTDAEIEEGGGDSHDISALLSASGDVFTSLSGYNLGAFRFRPRGYSSKYTNVLINGFGVNDVETGEVYWSNWGGLNDAMRNQSVVTGVGISDFTFGGFGGSTNIQTRASSFGQQIKGVYSRTNGNWQNRAMVTASTGKMHNGLSVAASVSKRWALEGYVDGTFYDAYGYFFSIEQKLAPRHSLGLVAFGAPSNRGRSGWNTQEVVDLTGNPHYNPNWGYQNGEKRNSNVASYHQPRFILSYYWDINEKSDLQANLSYMTGRGGTTALNWAYGNDPRPNYYRNLPSYYDPSDPRYDYFYNLWTSDDDAGRQLNWDALYFANKNKWYTQEDANGSGKSISGNFSKYIIEERRSDINQFGGNLLYHNALTDKIDFTAGADVYVHRTENFKVVNDLLGGDYWLDMDKFAEGDPAIDSSYYQSDLNVPNRVAEVGDIFGYHYLSRINKVSTFAQAKYGGGKTEVYLSGKVGTTQFWRDGLMRKGSFPTTSYGESDKNNFLDYAVKAGGVYKITGRHYLDLNLMTAADAPSFRNAFTSPRTRNDVLDDLRSEKINGFDANYYMRYPKVKLRLGYYLTKFTDGTWMRSFYQDDLNTFGNYSMVGVGRLNQGVELGVEAEVISGLSVKAAGAHGSYIYNSTAAATITRDNDAAVLSSRKVYLEGYHVGGMPETAGTFGLEYRGKQFYWINLNVCAFGNFYEELNPDRHTAEAVSGFAPTDPRREIILNQKKVNDGWTLNANIGKSFRIDYKYFIVVNLSVDNILNKKDIAIGAYEDLRYDVNNMDKFSAKYTYLYGTQFFLNVSLRF
ncbi:MAG: TonB-dependent receptor [Bacteroidales bacterium]|nr:TonB-dependent receptor [Bacteroidales bacterium]